MWLTWPARGPCGGQAVVSKPACSDASTHLPRALTLRPVFGRAGQPVYPPEHERILGQRARHTRRLQARMARRGGAFQLAYAVSMAACFALIAGDALARAAH